MAGSVQLHIGKENIVCTSLGFYLVKGKKCMEPSSRLLKRPGSRRREKRLPRGKITAELFLTKFCPPSSLRRITEERKRKKKSIFLFYRHIFILFAKSSFFTIRYIMKSLKKILESRK